MTEKRYFPALYFNKKADLYEAICGVRMVYLLKAGLLTRDYQTAEHESWHNPLHPSSLHISRVGFLKALSEWSENTVLQLHISAMPDLLFTPKGKISIAISMHSFDDTRNHASEAALSRFLQMKELLSIYFPEAEFTPISDVEELLQVISPFSPTHGLSITRRREELSLGKPFHRSEIGFSSAFYQDKNPDHTTIHLFPWTPSFSKLHKLIQFLLRQTHPVWIIVRLRPGKLTDVDQSRLSKTIETCEAFLNKTEECENVFTKMAEMMRDFSLERLVELHNVALNVGVFMLARHAIDPSECSVLGQAITKGYDREDKQGLLKGGFAMNPTPPEKALHCEFFSEDESFSAQEAACAFRLPAPPVGHLSGVPVKSSKTAYIHLPKGYSDRSNLIKLGVNQHEGIEQPVFISCQDRLRHVFLLGQTGTGKSTLLENMILQDIQAGRGLCLLDPHGELVESLLGKIPKERAEDVIIFDPMDRDRPVGFNLIEWNTIEERDFIIDELYLTLDRLYDMRQTGGPIFEANFRGMMKLLMGDQERAGFVPTALEFPILYLDSNFREWLRQTTGDSQVHDFIRELERTGGEASLNNLAPYITSKFSRFVNDIRLRRIIGQERTPFDFRDIMDNGKILLMSLGKGRFGEVVSGLLAGLVVSRFKAAAMSRADQPESARKNFFVYVDECHNLPKENFGELLSEARKYKLGLVLATQYADQLKGPSGFEKDDLLPAILGNVGTLIMFRIGIKDAEKIAPAFHPVFDHKDLVELPNFNACARFQVDGTFLPPFSFRTQKDDYAEDRTNAVAIRHRSKLKYGTDAEVVDVQIARRRAFWKNT